MMAARPVGMGGVFSGGGSTEALAGALTGLTNRGNESAYLVLLSILVNVLILILCFPFKSILSGSMNGN